MIAIGLVRFAVHHKIRVIYFDFRQVCFSDFTSEFNCFNRCPDIDKHFVTNIN